MPDEQQFTENERITLAVLGERQNNLRQDVNSVRELVTATNRKMDTLSEYVNHQNTINDKRITYLEGVNKVDEQKIVRNEISMDAWKVAILGAVVAVITTAAVIIEQLFI